MSIESITSATQASSNSGTALNSLADDLDSFLMILTTQLQNQDPLSPMDSTEFTNQLVEFANVEQAINQTQKLEDLIGLQKSAELTNAVGYMGKTVKVDHNEFSHASGETEELGYTLPETAKTATLFVFNEAGNLVYSSPVETAKGTHTVNWDAKDGSGNPMPAGNYHFEVSAVNAEAGTVEGIKYSYAAVVDAVEYGENSTTLKMGDISIDLGKVIAVAQPPASPQPAATSETETSTDEASNSSSEESNSSNTASDETTTDETATS